MARFGTYSWIAPAVATLLGASPLHASIQEDFTSSSWTDDWSWTTTTANGASGWSAVQSGTELSLATTAGSSGYDVGTLTSNTGVDPNGDGVAGNAEGIVTATWKLKWESDGNRMYPIFRLLTAPGSNDYLQLSLQVNASDIVDNSGRAIVVVNGSTVRTSNVNVTASEPEGSYGYIQFVLDVDAKNAFFRQSTDGVTFSTLQGMDLSTAAYNDFFASASSLTPQFLMEVRKDSGQGASRLVTFDSINVTAVPVPEPASLALIGLGGLLCLSRRRA